MEKEIRYTGGTGPTADQTEHNDQLLEKWLTANGYKHERVPAEYCPEFSPIQVEGKINVSYDRWGYVIDEAEEADQISLKQTTKLIEQMVGDLRVSS